jgi:hypothetical protein
LPESATFCGRKLELRQRIPAHWQLEIERRGKGKREEGAGLYRRVLDGHYCEILPGGGSNFGRFQEREGGGISGEEERDKGVPPVSSEEKKKKKKEGGRVAGLVRGGSGRLGPGRGPVGLCSLFFCSDSFSIFCFSLFFISFASVIQMTSNQIVKSSKIRLNILRQ